MSPPPATCIVYKKGSVQQQRSFFFLKYSSNTLEHRLGPFFGTIQAHVSAKAVEEEARSLLHYLLYELLKSGRSRAGSGGPHLCVMMASFLVGTTDEANKVGFLRN
jgi:hypothetical protein